MSYLVCVGGDACHSLHTKVKRVERVARLPHEGKKEPPETAVHMDRDVVAQTQLQTERVTLKEATDGC